MNSPQRLRILLVEDDAIFAAVTAEVMRERALVRWTPTAESAIAAAGEKEWDLIITDIELPGMSGLELVMKIKAAQPHVATLILTGHRSFDNAVEAIRVGADDFLTKPVDRSTLIEKIDELAAPERSKPCLEQRAVLAVGAHPDDVEVGCRRHAALPRRAEPLRLDRSSSPAARLADVPADRAREAARAAELMGVRLFHVNVGGRQRRRGWTRRRRDHDAWSRSSRLTRSTPTASTTSTRTTAACTKRLRSPPPRTCRASSATRAPPAPSSSSPSRFCRSMSSWTASSPWSAPTRRTSAAPLPRRRPAARDQPLLEPLRTVPLRRAVRGGSRDAGRRLARMVG